MQINCRGHFLPKQVSSPVYTLPELKKTTFKRGTFSHKLNSLEFPKDGTDLPPNANNPASIREYSFLANYTLKSWW